MKKRLQIFMMTLFISLTAGSAMATMNPLMSTHTDPLTKEQKEMLHKIKSRISEIKAIDRSGLNRQERKLLRKELRAMEKEARAIGTGGVFLTVGALLVVILLLILLL